MGGFDITSNETDSSVQGGELTHAMDVFSLGLVLSVDMIVGSCLLIVTIQINPN